MKVLIDGRILQPQITGVERYIQELLSQFEQENRAGIDFSIYLSDSSFTRFPNTRRQFPDAQQNVLSQYDVYHRPFQPSDISSIIELAAAPASVLTIHDLIGYHFSNYWENEAEFDHYRRTFEFAVAAADRLITISEANKVDLLNSLPISDDKIDVIYHGVSPRFRIIDERAKAAFLKKHQLEGGYLLSLGTDYPHKNRIGLLQAFELLLQDYPDARLLLVGPRRWCRTQPEAERLIRRLSPQAIEFGAFPDEELIELYNNARIFVCPSLYEGFGLPLLEAFACGIPTVCSNRTSLPELAGEAALVVDTTKPKDFFAALKAVYENEELRRELTAKGLKRAAAFTWESTVRQTIQVYEKAAFTSRAAKRALKPIENQTSVNLRGQNTETVLRLMAKEMASYAIAVEARRSEIVNSRCWRLVSTYYRLRKLIR